MCAVVALVYGCSGFASAQTLPPSEDIPEEVLQTQAIESARSRLDGQAQSPHTYAQEQQHLRVMPEDVPARLAPEVYQTIFLLRLQKLMKGLLPFL
ncbi:MAG: hypothetical protein WCD18_25510 [Thermosynechococcaceae cyanobacterium]